MINIALLGFGYWGKNLARNINNSPDCNLMYICEPIDDLSSQCKKHYPHVKVLANYEKILDDPKIDAVVIATPVSTHYELARASLEKNKHVLVEKPLTENSKTAHELCDLSKKKNKILMVDHTFLYTGAIEKIKELVEKKEIGALQYIDSSRINLGLFQRDVNVIWDLAPHDLSICLHLFDKMPKSVQATGISHLNNNMENIAYMTLNYHEDFIAHFNFSWISPVKVRKMMIGGNKKMIVYDDVEPTEKVKVYDSGITAPSSDNIDNFNIDYRTGDISVPKVSIHEALSKMINDFVESINQNKDPLSNSKLGYEVVKIIEASERSLKNNGAEEML